MRSSTAYFAGAGTVIAAIVAGLGGGYLFFSIVSPHPEKHGSSEVTRLERRMSPEPIPATNKGGAGAGALPRRAAGFGGGRRPAGAATAGAPATTTAASNAVSEPQQAQPQQQQAQPQQQQATRAATAAAANSAAAAAAATVPVAAGVDEACRGRVAHASGRSRRASRLPPPSSPPRARSPRRKNSGARARDADVRRDEGRARRTAQGLSRHRRQQWSERRKWRQRDDDGELIEVERKVREETEPRRIREDSEPRQFFASEPARIEMPGASGCSTWISRMDSLWLPSGVAHRATAEMHSEQA